MDGKRMAVFFPGGNYGIDHPLLYYARFAFDSRGYGLADIRYGDIMKRSASREEALAALREAARTQLEALDLRACRDVVFVSKSLGTVAALWAAETLNIRARHILLTPIPEALPFVRAGAGIVAVVSGTADPHVDAEALCALCESAGVYLLQPEDADHRLELPGDARGSLAILKAVTALCTQAAEAGQ